MSFNNYKFIPNFVLLSVLSSFFFCSPAYTSEDESKRKEIISPKLASFQILKEREALKDEVI